MNPVARVSAALAALLAAGCLSLPRPPTPLAARKRTFALEAAAPARRFDQPRLGPVKVRAFRAMPPFDTRAFIVRRPGGEMIADPLHAWIAPPRDLIRAQATRYFEQTGLFEAVYDAGVGALPPFSLEGVISDWFLDFSGETPAAVVGIRLLLLDERAMDFAVRLTAQHTARVACASADPEDATRAFNQALTETLAALAEALAAAEPPP